MNNSILNDHILASLNNYNSQLEKYLGSHVIAYVGGLFSLGNQALDNIAFNKYLKTIENLKKTEILTEENVIKSPNTLYILLYTLGGNVEIVDKLNFVTRQHFENVNFIIPNIAMSAGTIWAMSGNKILMDYSSSLGPIDPQVYKNNQYLSVLGYLEQWDEINQKENITQAEKVLLNKLDLGELELFKQGKELSVKLTINWLQEYQKLNKDEAENIANILIDHKAWNSHGRYIDIKYLKNLGLKIEDYTGNEALTTHLRLYSALLLDYLQKENVPMIIHNYKC